MRYDEFRDRLQLHLREAGLFLPPADRPIESVDLAYPERRWKVFIGRSTPQKAEPFHVSAKISFRWGPFEAARSYTCEDDLLTELLGRKASQPRTQPRFLRIDLGLYATLPYGSTTPMPDPQVLGPWTVSAGGRLDELLSETKERQGRVAAVMGYRGDLAVEVRYTREGVLSLERISLSGFRFVRLPRVWDDPERREAEKDGSKELDGLARRFKDSYDEWTRSIGELATWLRYSPPPPGATPPAGLGSDDEEEDDEPETTH